MPTTLVSLVILVAAVLPGILGDTLYRLVVGVHWREQEWRSVLRLISFSAAGAVIYLFSSLQFRFPTALHLVPGFLEAAALDPELVNQLAGPYAGHIVGGAVAGLAAGGARLLLTRALPRSAFPSAWDDFVRDHVSRRWVILSLNSGEVYAGQVANADISVPTSERDLVLAEPCRFEEEANDYRALNYQYLFVPAGSIYSIAGVYQESDSRTIEVGEYLYKGDDLGGTSRQAGTPGTNPPH